MIVAILVGLAVSALATALMCAAGARLNRTPQRPHLTVVPTETPDPELLRRASTWSSW